MQENTMSYYGKPLGWIGNFKDEDGKKFSPAFQLIFRIMISCTAETKTFSVITVQTIQRETGFSERNIIRAFEFFQKRGFVRRCKQWFSGMLMDAWEFLAHPYVVAWYAFRETMQSKKQAACSEQNQRGSSGQFVGNLSSRLTIGNKKENISPLPPKQKQAADAAQERGHEQKIATHVEPQEKHGPEDCRSNGVPGRCAGLPISGRTSNSASAGGLRSESSTLQQAAAPERTEETCPLTNNCWQAALALLLQKLPQQEVNLWLAPIQALESEKGLRLDCPDKYAMAWVQEHFGKSIKDALQHLGITEFYFSFGEQEKKLQQEKNQEQRAEAAQRAADQAQTLQNLPLREQFAALLAVYPRKTSGEWFAWQTFKRLKRKGELPETSELLQMIKAKTQTEDWSRDAGRWIPGLSKWLNNRPWWKIDCKERGKKPHEATLRGGKGSICCQYR